ncbi:unnamed protein product [Symbiodinium sp. KB8]|nr:unnamed protein product [Symbiodinium sp. KB8]
MVDRDGRNMATVFSSTLAHADSGTEWSVLDWGSYAVQTARGARSSAVPMANYQEGLTDFRDMYDPGDSVRTWMTKDEKSGLMRMKCKAVSDGAVGKPLQEDFQSLLKRLTAEVDAIKPPAQETTTAAPVPAAEPASAAPAAEPSRKIPKKLLFNHKVNLLKIPDAQMNPGDKLLRENILHIMSIFPEVSQEDVHFWNDEDCANGLEALNMQESEALSIDFVSEQVGMVKSDICRLAMMYTLGGYYFDTDILVTPELKAPLGRICMLQGLRFLAASQKHPLMELALKEFKDWYDKLRTPGVNQAQMRVSVAQGNIGTGLLRKAYDNWSRDGPMPKVSHPGGHVSQFFEETPINWLPRAQYPGDYAVVNKLTNKVVLYSRVYDSHHHQECSEEVKLMRSMGRLGHCGGQCWDCVPGSPEPRSFGDLRSSVSLEHRTLRAFGLIRLLEPQLSVLCRKYLPRCTGLDC